MRVQLGMILLWSGVAAGVLAVAVAVIGLPAALPPALVTLLAVKLAAAAAVGLLAAGAYLRRTHSRQLSPRVPTARPDV